MHQDHSKAVRHSYLTIARNKRIDQGCHYRMKREFDFKKGGFAGLAKDQSKRGHVAYSLIGTSQAQKDTTNDEQKLDK